MRGARAQQLAEQVHGLRIAFATRIVRHAIRGKFAGAVARGRAQHQAPARQLVDAGGRLGQVDGMAQGKNGAARGQGQRVRARRQVGEIGPRVEQLARIAESRVEQGNIAHPGGGEALPVHGGDQVGLAGQRPHVALVKTQRQVNAEGKRAGREHAAVAAVLREGLRRGAFRDVIAHAVPR
ncbi:hypothetical protein D3C81_1682990 [compost metagenome]